MKTTTPHILALRSAIVTGLAFAAAFAHAEGIGYAQADTSSNATTVVLVGAVGANSASSPAALVSANYTRWNTGEAGGIGYVPRWALASDAHQWLVGAGIGANAFRSRAVGDTHSESALSARAQSEWFGPAPAGSYYALAQVSTFRRSWLAAAQYSPSALPVAAEWARYHERGYQATSIGARISIGIEHWYLRLGATRADAETRPYIGIAYNAF